MVGFNCCTNSAAIYLLKIVFCSEYSISRRKKKHTVKLLPPYNHVEIHTALKKTNSIYVPLTQGVKHRLKVPFFDIPLNFIARQ